MRTLSRLGRALPCLALLLLVRLCLPGPPAMAAPILLEDLRYRIEVLAWPDAARVRLTLNRVGPDRFEAEFIGESLGIFKTLSGGQRERLQTEMVWRNHQLLPLIYREESWRRGKRRLKEYRFDYDKGRLVLWEWHKSKGLTKKWQGDLATPVYDPLSAFYNIRLGLIGPNRAGETNAIPGIPYPRPGTMEVRLAATPDSHLKAMISLINPVFPDSQGQVMAYVDHRLVPQQAWTTISGFTIRGMLLPGGVIMPHTLPGLAAPGHAADHRPPAADLPATADKGERR
ncbi:MAG: hypothetical protein A2139_01460 [Desulfobacca sp. RBG_16_60_12]|nr:MAG: hypothetical protein A2139_01460 [Desulfobacca sp. RBG_16_60_12]